MIIIIIASILLFMISLALYSTNNVPNILFSILVVSGIGYLIRYRY